jgi:hypothetical protein
VLLGGIYFVAMYDGSTRSILMQAWLAKEIEKLAYSPISNPQNRKLDIRHGWMAKKTFKTFRARPGGDGFPCFRRVKRSSGGTVDGSTL